MVSAILVMVMLACQKEVTSSNENHREQMPTVIQDKESSNQKEQESQVWIPEVIKKCVAKVDVGEPLEMDTSVNPFYLRANFDGNRLIDYAVVVNGQKTRKRGVVICKDSTRAYIFGSVTKPKESFTGIEDDNFVTENWEILSVEESKYIYDAPGHKVATGAKGESVAFIFEDGIVHIFWDGKTFQVMQGI